MTKRATVAICLTVLLIPAGLIFISPGLLSAALALGAVLILSGAAALLCKGAECAVYTPETVYRSDEISVRVKIKGFCLFPAVIYIVLDEPDNPSANKKMKNRRRKVYEHTGGRINAEVDASAGCKHSGRYMWLGAEVYAGDVFGFFRVKIRRDDGKRQLLVLPKPHEVSLDDTAAFGNAQVNVTEMTPHDCGTFADTREYYPGDPLRSVHWKQSVRTGKLHVMKYEDSSEHDAVIFIDTYCGFGDVRAYKDAVCEAAVSIAASYISSCKSVGVYCSDIEGSADISNETEVFELCMMLAKTGFYKSESDFGDAAQVGLAAKGTGKLYFFSDRIGGSVFSELSSCLKNLPFVCFVPFYGKNIAKDELGDGISVYSLDLYENTPGGEWGEWH